MQQWAEIILKHFASFICFGWAIRGRRSPAYIISVLFMAGEGSAITHWKRHVYRMEKSDGEKVSATVKNNRHIILSVQKMAEHYRSLCDTQICGYNDLCAYHDPQQSPSWSTFLKKDKIFVEKTFRPVKWWVIISTLFLISVPYWPRCWYFWR